jgi:hypothetical protein
MSEIREELLRTLDKIVAEHPANWEPSTAEVDAELRRLGSSEPRSRQTVAAGLANARRLDAWKALTEAGFASVGGTGRDGDIDFQDAVAVIRRAAYHTLDYPMGDLVMARRIAARASLAETEDHVTFAPSATPEGIALYHADDGMPQVRGTTQDAGHIHGNLLVDCVDDQGRECLAIVRRSDVTEILGLLDRNIADEYRQPVHLYDRVGLRRQSVLASTPYPNARNELIQDGALLRAIQMAGAMDRVLEHALTWVNDRVQFGKPIAKHQAVQHLMAQLAEEVAAASAAVDFAVEASAAKPDRFAIAVAKARAGEAAGKAANIAHAVFGAMGFTREHTLHHATRRLWAWRNEFGSETYWQGEIGRSIAAGGGASLWPTLTARG